MPSIEDVERENAALREQLAAAHETIAKLVTQLLAPQPLQGGLGFQPVPPSGMPSVPFPPVPPSPFNPLGGHGGFCACSQCCPAAFCAGCEGAGHVGHNAIPINNACAGRAFEGEIWCGETRPNVGALLPAAHNIGGTPGTPGPSDQRFGSPS